MKFEFEHFKLYIILVFLAIGLATSEALIKSSYTELGITGFGEFIKLFSIKKIFSSYLYGFTLFALAWILAILVRIALSVPFSKINANVAIPFYRLIVILSSVVIGIIVFEEDLNLYTFFGILFGLISLLFYSISEDVTDQSNLE